MADEIEENIYLVNAPAGSGKTTTIKAKILEHTISSPLDNILCITYTNRAVNELKQGISNSHVYISTIHSFINELISPFFKLEKIKKLYFEVFGKRIENRISNEEEDIKIKKSNDKYKSVYGDLSISIIKSNLKSISYGETQFSSLYYGRLSHDDLLLFAKKIIETYSNVRKKISNKYQIIFIDEYQDTSADVLNIFYQSVKNTDTKLFLLGDKMQQIYRNYDGSFEDTLKRFNTGISLRTNHRSIKLIVDILNNLYNNELYSQEPDKKIMDIQPDFKPRIILSDNIEGDIEKIRKKYPDTLVLYLYNKERFKEIGAEGLWSIYGNMEQYSYGKKYSAVDVLTDISEDNTDGMMKFLFIICDLNYYWKKKQYGNIISKTKKYKDYFDINVNSIMCHTDKSRIKSLWLNVFDNYYTKNIGDIINCLKDNKILKESCMEMLNPNNEYDDVLNISIKEVDKLYRYIKEPHISTQHGVKGESHDTVVFVASDSFKNPFVYMYKFFELFAITDFSLDEFENFYYSYAKYVTDIKKSMGIKSVKTIDRPFHQIHKTEFIENSKKIINKYKDNKFFNKIAKDIYDTYLKHQTVTNAKNCFKDNNVYGVLSAYRLFYVGCSRARRNLTVIVDKQKIIGFESIFKKKFENVGFIVE